VQSPMDQSVAIIDRLILAGRESEAVAGLRDLIAKAPDLGDGWSAVLSLCDRLGDEDSGLEVARLYGKSGVEQVSRQTDYGRRLARVGRMDEALEFMGKVSAHFSEDADAAFEHGTLLAQAGQFEQAETVLRRAIALRPAFGDAWVQLGAFLDFSSRPDDVEAMRAAGTKSACAMDFAFGKALDDVGDTAGAMAAWDRANEKQRTIRAPDRRLLDFTEQLSEQFSALQSGLPTGMTEARAIFIVGAPRTGTTLVEQILSAHPDVYGMGETLISRVATWPVRHLSPPDMAQLDALGPVAWQQIGQIYTSLASKRSGAAPVVTDKAAALHLFVGVLAQALPNAKFIWVKRTPEAAALSAYRAHFGLNHPWSTDLKDIFEFLSVHDRLCRHWQSLLGERMLEVSYEQLVTSPDAEIARLISHCDLSASDAPRQFHTNDRPVQTASLGQVRRPISTASVQGWQRYEAVLAAAKASATTTRGQ